MTTTQEKTQPALTMVEEKFGFVPAVFHELANSPAVLQVYLRGQGALEEGVLSPGQRQAGQLAISVLNGCHYCVAAHAKGCAMAGLSREDIEAIKRGDEPADKDAGAVVAAVRRLWEKKGWLEAADVADLAGRGLDKAGLYEVIAIIGLKTITNYVNHIAGTKIDEQFAE